MTPDPHLDLDGRSLALLVAVHDTGSVTAAAQRLGLSQSAVSHALDRLRALVGDALFVKSGRGIAPTARADALAAQARELLDAMRRFTQPGAFDPHRLDTVWTVAANDFQCELLLPRWLQRIQAHAPGFRLHVIPSTVPTLEMLRGHECQLAISPRPPEGDDVVRKRLFADRWRVFFDPAMRTAPATFEDYRAAEHVSVQYVPSMRGLDIDRWLREQGLPREVAITVPAFAGMRPFVLGSTRLATGPGRLAQGLMQGLAASDLPIPAPEMPMYAIWHLRHQQDPTHQWLRRQLDDVVREAELV